MLWRLLFLSTLRSNVYLTRECKKKIITGNLTNLRKIKDKLFCTKSFIYYAFWISDIRKKKYLLITVRGHPQIGGGSRGIKDFVTTASSKAFVLKRLTMGGGGVKKYPKLHDVIYGWPLIWIKKSKGFSKWRYAYFRSFSLSNLSMISFVKSQSGNVKNFIRASMTNFKYRFPYQRLPKGSLINDNTAIRGRS